MTITPEQLDELERRTNDFNESELSLVPIACTAALRLVAIARAALAWRDAGMDAYSKDAAIDGLLAALRGTP